MCCFRLHSDIRLVLEHCHVCGPPYLQWFSTPLPPVIAPTIISASSVDSFSATTLPSIVPTDTHLKQGGQLIKVQPISVSDTSPIDSAASSLGEQTSAGKRVCQAHLLHYDRDGGPALSLRPRSRRLVKALPLLSRDSLLQNGINVIGGSDPVMINLRQQHRAAYSGRSVELKCQTKG